jgi:hypothetical protein
MNFAVARLKTAFIRHQNIWLALSGTFIAVALNAAATRGERVVNWDAFQYISLARVLSGHFPNHLGGHYPWGFPLLAGPLIAAHVQPYFALVSISIVAYGILLFVISRALGEHAQTRTLRMFVPALGLIPIVFVFASDAMSESLFTLLVFCAAWLLTKWSQPRTIYLTALVIVLAFSVRYAGAFLVPGVVAWVVRDRFTVRSIPLRHALAGIAITGAAIAALLLSNLHATGFVSGGPMTPGDHTLTAFMHHLADFGFGAIGMVPGRVSVLLFYADPRIEFATGLLCAVVLIGIAIEGLRARRNALTNACSLLFLSYLATILFLQSATTFADPGRYFIPAIPLLFVVVLDLLSNRALIVTAITGLLFVIAVHTGARAPESGVSKDLSATSAFLQSGLGPTTRVLINFDALSLSSRLNGTIWVGFHDYDPKLGYVFAIDPSRFLPHRNDYLVICAHQAGHPSIEPYWMKYLTAAIRNGQTKVVYANHNVIVAQFVR